MTENQRLKLLMDLLHFKTQKAFAEKLDIKPGSLSDIFREKKGMGVSSNIKYKLKLSFNVNLDWLNNGNGEPFLATNSTIEESGVPFFNINIADKEFENLVFEEKPDYFVNYKPFNDCTAYLPVYGDSMYPKYASGEVIAVKEIKNYNVIQWGEAYVILTNERSNGIRSIKTIHEHTDPEKLILKSTNPNFKGETIIKKSDILSLYVIKGKITRNMI